MWDKQQVALFFFLVKRHSTTAEEEGTLNTWQSFPIF